MNQEDRFSGNIAGTEQKNYTLLKKGQLSYNHGNSKLAKYGAVFELRTYEEALVPRVYHSFKTTNEADPAFIEYLFASKLPDIELSKLISSGARMNGLLNINYDQFMGISIKLPAVEEQIRIGQFFRNVDYAITLHQRKLESMKLLKKSLLQKMFPKSGETVPEVRFPGFTDAWEQRKLGEISEKVTTKNQDMVVNEVFTNSAEYGIISQQDFFDKDIANSNKVDGYYLVEPDDFVYNPRISNSAPFGPIKRNKLGRSGAMSPLYYVFRSHDVDKSYLDWFFQTNRWHAFMRFHGNTGVRSDRFAITDKIFAEMTISIPQDIDEQKAIGTFFTALDDSITLHQRKLEGMKLLKKSLLQKMFPKSGESVPEVRFPGFTDAWEQRKFSEVFYSIPNNTLSRSELSTDEGTVKNIHYGDVLINFDAYIDVQNAVLPRIVNDAKATKAAKSTLKDGDVVIADTAEDETVGKCAEIGNLVNDVVVSGLHTIPSRPKFKFGKGYLGFYMNSSAYHDQLRPLIQGIKVSSISKSALAKTELKYPKNMAEQEKIGSFFLMIDNTITLHQRKVEALQKLKKSLLQQMFV